MLFKIIGALILLSLGLLSFNNYFLFFPDFGIIPDRILMLITGIALILASLIIFTQRILLKFHKTF